MNNDGDGSITRWPVVGLTAASIIAILTYIYLAAGLFIGSFMAVMLDATGQVFPEVYPNLVCASVICGLPLAVVSLARFLQRSQRASFVASVSAAAFAMVLVIYLGSMREEMPFIARPQSAWFTPIALLLVVLTAILVSLFIERRTRSNG